MVDMASPFAGLPPEFVHHILNLAAAASRYSVLALCLVASWVRRIALPHLFHTSVIKDLKSYKQFEDIMRLPSDFDFCAASAVHNFWMDPRHFEIGDLMSVCTNYNNPTHIAACLCELSWMGFVRWHWITFAHGSGRDLKLTVLAPMPSSSGPATVLFFRRVTHICLDIDAYARPCNLERFSRLSHLAVPYVGDGDPSYPTGGLQPFLKLQSSKMLVVVVIKADLVDAARENWANWVKEMRKMDSRVYFAEHDAKYTIRGEWQKEMRGGVSIWDRAIQFTAEWEAANANL